MTLLFVLVAYRLDLAIGVDYIRDAVIIGFIANELISIVENAGLMGIPLPAVIANAIDILTQKAERKGRVERPLRKAVEIMNKINRMDFQITIIIPAIFPGSNIL